MVHELHGVSAHSCMHCPSLIDCHCTGLQVNSKIAKLTRQSPEKMQVGVVDHVFDSISKVEDSYMTEAQQQGFGKKG